MAESLGVTTETFAYDGLIAGDTPIVTRSIVLITGQNLVRGALLGKIDLSGKYTLSLAAAIDGSENPTAILAKDTNATSADRETVAYEAGEFNQDKMTFGTGHTAASTRAALRDLNIHLKEAVSA